MRNPRGRALFMGAAGQGRQHRRQTSDEGRTREHVAERPPTCRRLRELDFGRGLWTEQSPLPEGGRPARKEQPSNLADRAWRRAIYTWSRLPRAKAKCASMIRINFIVPSVP